MTTILYHLDDSTSVNDSSGHELHGSAFGATWTPEGKFGGAIVFDGDDHLETPSTPLLGSGDLTLEAWVKRGADMASILIDLRGYGFPLNDGAFLGIDGTGRPYASAHLSHIGIYRAVATSAAPLDTWVHVAAIFAESEGKVRIAVNGVVEAEANLARVPSGDSATIGRTRVGAEHTYFVGTLDEIRLSNVARSTGPVLIEQTTWTRVKTLWR